MQTCFFRVVNYNKAAACMTVNALVSRKQKSNHTQQKAKAECMQVESKIEKTAVSEIFSSKNGSPSAFITGNSLNGNSVHAPLVYVCLWGRILPYPPSPRGVRVDSFTHLNLEGRSSTQQGKEQQWCLSTKPAHT